MQENLIIAGKTVKPGQRKRIPISISKLYDFTGMHMPIEVIRGKDAGATLFITAAIHGDES